MTPKNFVRHETNRNLKLYGGIAGGTNIFYKNREFGANNTSGKADQLYIEKT